MNDDTFRETLYTINKEGRRQWVYPTILRGFFYTKRQVVAYVLILFYLALPWITVNGRQAVHLDLGERQFTFFGNTFWATDSYFLFLVLASLALSLFFFTAIFGRIWCGWACPETVFLEFVFRPLETLIEGGPVQRKRLDEAPWTTNKLVKKTLKFILFALIAWFLASTALAYFFGRETLFTMMSAPPWENWGPFLTTLFLMGGLLFQFGWFREQFCTVLCPYARFQSALLDSDSLIVGYDVERGEPRGRKKKGEINPLIGDCINCGLCVRVCPTGIDIRNGLQLECIQCAACADACDSVMAKLDRPLGLIRYDTEDGIRKKKYHLLRPRTILYGAILLGLLAALTYLLATRSLSDADILRGPGDAPFTVLADGHIQNHLSLRISNKDRQTRNYHVSLPEDSRVQLTAPVPLPVAGETIKTLPLFFTFPSSLLEGGTHKISVTVSNDAGFTRERELTLLGPG